jgi:hypothetical protein
MVGVGLAALWLPILLAAVLVFIASSVIHMATPWHKKDFPPVPNEDQVRAAIRPLNIPPGEYMIPRAGTSEEMKAPEFQEKLRQGPVLMLSVFRNEMFNMGASLGQWFVYCVVVGIFTAYLTSRTLAPGTEYLEVFRVAGTTAFLGYTLALWQGTIWYKRSAATTMRQTVDGLIYALLTAGVFAWRWPGA